MRWIIDPNNGVESPLCTLFAMLINSGADALGPARRIVAQLLESVVAPCLREKGRENLGVLSEFTYYPLHQEGLLSVTKERTE